mmetsp:Transcript_31318/g.63540  ORF Transcript_31318/g.63540 Transcript_31318/m.63540 type:complete len:241 (+) Transcript_31318:574-1296(+)
MASAWIWRRLGVLWYRAVARSMLRTIMSTSSPTMPSPSSSCSITSPVRMSCTVSASPPVGATIGMVPKRMPSICTSPHGSYRDGISAKSAAEYVLYFSAPLNDSTARQLRGYFSSRSAATDSSCSMPEPMATNWKRMPFLKAWSIASNMMSTPFCASRRPMKMKSGISASTSNPSDACICIFPCALMCSVVASYCSGSPSSGLDGSTMSSTPLRMPLIPFMNSSVSIPAPLFGDDTTSRA